jgi:cell division protein FtsZ
MTKHNQPSAGGGPAQSRRGTPRKEEATMTTNTKVPDIRELKPRITVIGVGGAGGNAVNNMIASGLEGCEFVVANTDAQALTSSKAQHIIQMGVQVTEGLGAGSQPEVGRAAADEVLEEIRGHLQGSHMVFVTAGMGGGTGTGAAPVVARCAKEAGILTVGVVTKPFHFEGARRMRMAEAGIGELQKVVDTLLVIPNQNLFRVANEKTTFADAFAMADQVLYSGVACITDLMVKEGLINLDFADVRAVMREMGKAMMGTGEASGEKRALASAEAAISNPLIDDASMKGAKGLLISITGGRDLTLYEVDEAATRIREEVDQDANIIVGATYDENLEGIIRVSVVATGIDQSVAAPRNQSGADSRLAELAQKLRQDQLRLAERVERAETRAPMATPVAPPSMGAPASSTDAIESAARAAVAAAVLPLGGTDDVTIRPMAPKPPMLLEPAPEDSEEELPPEGAFIPPTPDRSGRGGRPMPRLEDLPIPGQNELRAVRGETGASDLPEKRRIGLLQRLASVGLGRRDMPGESESPADGHRPAQLEPPRPSNRPGAGRQSDSRSASDSASEYGKRHGHQGLDPLGRQAPVNNSPEEDQLEIPAFLRRQAT